MIDNIYIEYLGGLWKNEVPLYFRDQEGFGDLQMKMAFWMDLMDVRLLPNRGDCYR